MKQKLLLKTLLMAVMLLGGGKFCVGTKNNLDLCLFWKHLWRRILWFKVRFGYSPIWRNI